MKHITETREVAAFAKTYEMKMVSIPLVNRATTRIAYAQFSMTLDCGSEGVLKSMELNRAKLLDTVYTVASNFYLEDFDTPEGLKLFKSQLMNAYYKYFGVLTPRRLTINDWIIN